MKLKVVILSLSVFAYTGFTAQNIQNNPGSNHGNKFEQLGTILPTPNIYRTASGAPGHAYWQNRADYNITAYLDEDKRNLKGSETVTYYNNSPDELDYIWLQLDENEHSSIRNAGYDNSSILKPSTTDQQLKVTELPVKDNGYGVILEKVTDASGSPLQYTVNKTMMRIDLPKALKKGEKFVFKVDWNYNISNRMKMGGRGGYENFPEDGNDLYTMTQWFPRMCVYSDFQGWQNHQFTGRGEFALVFGNYKVSMNVPADHIVGGTGECKNYDQVLTADQLSRYRKAENASEPIEIVTLDEAKKAEKNHSKQRKTWVFEANDVRDFAWTSSRKFVWDGMRVTIPENNNKVMAMSFYPKESYGLYRKFSTKAVAHTIKTYSEFTIPYPYPVAQSVEASSGMEYPMICFNFGRTEKDGTYSEGTKNGMIGVIIHEVGHNFFPMIINSDERQWAWMDEGLNTFTEYLTEEKWDNKFPSKRGPAWTIVDYMKLPKDQLEPIMSNSENIIQYGPNAYSKPATGLNILRETIMGRELFDKAFKTYAKRWAFKHPEPADLFRTMEDASGEDLDWFWRGWFYGTDPVDIAIDKVTVATPNLETDPKAATEVKYQVDKPLVNSFEDLSKIRNREDKNITFYVDKDKEAQDFYYRYDRGQEKVSTKEYTTKVDVTLPLDAKDKEKFKNITAYQIDFVNKGGLIMPIILEFTFEDGSKLYDKSSAQIWRLNEQKVSKTYYFDKKLKSIQLDPMRETADIDTNNNLWTNNGSGGETSKFQLFKQKQEGGPARGSSTGKVNPMQAAGKI
ncbi:MULTISPECIES: M1 family metallopeptidase [unclassified Chryseobacterium]|uniref:M1 family metallopeptidase n=1 Tax=unclassified Chryseobacterium TaxID=2593645 RepID=UPI00100ABA0B|nr:MULTISPECIES: M1 family metallopeptidase [unclassified Chryseobacterium]RXM52591.1 aminopeptidase [Chryseobacterium sp. CH25]RXM66647.1 aminopeptidase [Chryseobacterium sp. CH1]